MAEELDLLLVFPNNRRNAYGSLADTHAGINAPLQTALTAGYVRKAGHSVRIIDADAESLSPEETAARIASAGARLVLISTDSLNSGDVTKMGAASELLQALRKIAPGVTTMLEGVVPSAFPVQMLEKEGADFVCQGEAFDQVVDLLGVLKSGAPHPSSKLSGISWMDAGGPVVGGRRALIKNPDSLPFAAWDLLPMSRYRAHHWHCFDRLERRQPYASIYTNLGCPYTCSFCNVNAVAGQANFRARTPENVVEELDLLVKRYGVSNIRIVDNVFTIRPDLVEKLCDLIIARGYELNFWAYCRVETIKNPELLRKMKRAGVNWVAFGIEAADDKVRDAVDKGSSQASIDRAIELTRQAGIHIVGNFIFGLPEDTHDTMRKTFEMAKKYLFEYANFYSAMAYPGTELHEQAKKEGILLPTSWKGYGQYSEEALPMSTKHLSPAEVLAFRDRAFVEYTSDPAYLDLVRRRFGEPAVDFLRGLLKIKLRRRLLETA
ncbi:MAG TPA: radical SAM protein [Planctomycetota bacterium]|nr:radical SAM protein [Planctomycetota bacterium]